MTGPLGPIGPMAPATAQARAAAMMEACRAGVCRYVNPHHPPHPVADGCEGYAAHVYLEDGGAVLRWGRCPRFRAWWAAEKLRLEKRRAAETRARKGRQDWDAEA